MAHPFTVKTVFDVLNSYGRPATHDELLSRWLNTADCMRVEELESVGELSQLCERNFTSTCFGMGLLHLIREGVVEVIEQELLILAEWKTRRRTIDDPWQI